MPVPLEAGWLRLSRTGRLLTRRATTRMARNVTLHRRPFLLAATFRLKPRPLPAAWLWPAYWLNGCTGAGVLVAGGREGCCLSADRVGKSTRYPRGISQLSIGP